MSDIIAKFKSHLVETIKATQLLPHLPFLRKHSANIYRTEATSRRVAVELLLEKLEACNKHGPHGWFQAFLEALRKEEYDETVNLLECAGTESPEILRQLVALYCPALGTSSSSEIQSFLVEQKRLKLTYFEICKGTHSIKDSEEFLGDERNLEKQKAALKVTWERDCKSWLSKLLVALKRTNNLELIHKIEESVMEAVALAHSNDTKKLATLNAPEDDSFQTLSHCLSYASGANASIPDKAQPFIGIAQVREPAEGIDSLVNPALEISDNPKDETGVKLPDYSLSLRSRESENETNLKAFHQQIEGGFGLSESQPLPSLLEQDSLTKLKAPHKVQKGPTLDLHSRQQVEVANTLVDWEPTDHPLCHDSRLL